MVFLRITIALILFLFVFPGLTLASSSLWSFQSIDTVKYSRDRARDKSVIKKIPTVVGKIADLGATHIAINTPYDEEFYPFLSLWVKEARKHHLKVWFRGNFSGWEGWFSYPKLSSINEHHQKTREFITSHPDLFQEGDIFTPAPEPENGLIGDPRKSSKQKGVFLSFLEESYETCSQAFLLINKKTKCGYFSVNGDVAKYILTPDVVRHTGNVVVIDHYVKNPQQLDEDIKFLHNKLGVHVVLGEYGAPIPDIHGNLSEDEQADQVGKLTEIAYENRNIVDGINYWTFIEASTALMDDNMKPKKASKSIEYYFKPGILKGIITDQSKKPLSNVHIKTVNGKGETISNDEGEFLITLPPGSFEISIAKEGYITKKRGVSIHAEKALDFNFAIEEKNQSLMYKITTFIQSLISRISRLLK